MEWACGRREKRYVGKTSGSGQPWILDLRLGGQKGLQIGRARAKGGQPTISDYCRR